MKMLLLMPMLLIIASNVVYHLSQKTIPHEANPALSLLVSYAVAFVLTLMMLPLFGRFVAYTEALQTLNISSVLVGVSAVGVELGWLLVYRSGWQLLTVELLPPVRFWQSSCYSSELFSFMKIGLQNIL